MAAKSFRSAPSSAAPRGTPSCNTGDRERRANTRAEARAWRGVQRALVHGTAGCKACEAQATDAALDSLPSLPPNGCLWLSLSPPSPPAPSNKRLEQLKRPSTQRLTSDRSAALSNDDPFTSPTPPFFEASPIAPTFVGVAAAADLLQYSPQWRAWRNRRTACHSAAGRDCLAAAGDISATCEEGPPPPPPPLPAEGAAPEGARSDGDEEEEGDAGDSVHPLTDRTMDSANPTAVSSSSSSSGRGKRRGNDRA